MKTTSKYFSLTVDELMSTRNEYGYTREECKLFDEGLKVYFCDNVSEFEKEKNEIIDWYKNSQGLDFSTALITVNERIAMIFN